MNINYEHYKVFYHVAKQGSITLAAQNLYISQPAVSKSITQLEKELGCPLFIRHAGGMTLTENGADLFKHIAVAHDEIQMAEDRLEKNTRPEDVLRLRADDFSLRAFAGPVIHRFMAEHPTCRLGLKCDDSVKAVDAVRQGDADICIATGQIQGSPDLEITPLKEFTPVLLVKPGLLAFSPDEPVPIDSLLPFPLICTHRESPLLQGLMSQAIRKNRKPHAFIEVGSMDLVLSYTEMGNGIGAALLEPARPMIDDGRLQVITAGLAGSPVAISCILRKNTMLTDSAISFMELVRQTP